jgi:hypothetical protein
MSRAKAFLLVGMALLFIGCAKGEGRTCYAAAECDEGLVCVGDDVRRCESCASSQACKDNGQCTAKGNRCVKDDG